MWIQIKGKGKFLGWTKWKEILWSNPIWPRSGRQIVLWINWYSLINSECINCVDLCGSYPRKKKFNDKILQDVKRKMSVQEKWQIFFFVLKGENFLSFLGKLKIVSKLKCDISIMHKQFEDNVKKFSWTLISENFWKKIT